MERAPYYVRREVPPILHSVEFSWKFVSDVQPPTPWQNDAQHTLVERSTRWYKDLDECLAAALNCQIDSAEHDVENTHLVIEAKVFGDWTTLTNNNLRQTFNVYAARRLFYPTTLQCR